MRVGRFAVIVGTKKSGGVDCVATSCYAGRLGDDGSIKPGSKYWENHKRDRLSQLTNIEDAVRSSHPLYAEILADIALERKHLEK